MVAYRKAIESCVQLCNMDVPVPGKGTWREWLNLQRSNGLAWQATKETSLRSDDSV